MDIWPSPTAGQGPEIPEGSMKADIVTDFSRMPEFKIENKPVIRPRMEVRRYPFPRMKVGQSFYFEVIGCNDLNRIRSAASQYTKRHGGKFSIIREGEGYRCGKIE